MWKNKNMKRGMMKDMISNIVFVEERERERESRGGKVRGKRKE